MRELHGNHLPRVEEILGWPIFWQVFSSWTGTEAEAEACGWCRQSSCLSRGPGSWAGELHCAALTMQSVPGAFSTQKWRAYSLHLGQNEDFIIFLVA